MNRRLRNLLVIRYKKAFLLVCLFFLEREGGGRGGVGRERERSTFFFSCRIFFKIANLKRLSIRELSHNYNTAPSLQHLW